MEERELQPTTTRLLHLDVLRGFALLGILLVNFQWFSRPLQSIVLAAEPSLAGLDLAAEWLIRALAEGKFYPIFSMLFGAGFALMAERARDRQTGFWPLYLRRLVFLGLFGLGHMLLVWAGDILLIYSLCAFVMVLLFRNTPMRRLWKWSLVFWALPVVLMWLGALSIEISRLDPEAHTELMAGFEQDEAQMRESIDRTAEIHASGSWTENVSQRVSDMGFLFTYSIFWVPPILGFFLLGRWLIASGRLTHPDQHVPWLRRWRTRGLLFGLPLAVVSVALLHGASPMMPDLRVAVGTTVGIIAGVVLALAYLAAVTLGTRRLAFLAPAGQMALTNYLAQSLFWTWMIYGYGVGLWGQIPRSAQLLLAVVFFAVQVAWSRWWLERFRFGPAEWLWRTLTYWQLQPFTRRPGPVDSG